jgi:molybdenum cofactor synthesis domain-containing protein
MRERSCALVVVGNEILSGKVRDQNAYLAARELRGLGVSVRRMAVVPDELQAIADEVRACSARFDFVLTSGGVGPTHDDLTVEAVALAFKRRLIIHPELERLTTLHYAGHVEAAGHKMTRVPEGAVLNFAGDLWFPTLQVENVYLLPGIPELFAAKLHALAERFAADPYFMRTVYTRAGESAIAEHLTACLAEFPELMLGSYPELDEANYRVKITLESKDAAYLDRAFSRLVELLPKDAVCKVE